MSRPTRHDEHPPWAPIGLALVALALVAPACSGSAVPPPASPATSPTGGNASQTSLPSPAFTELAVPQPRIVSMLIPFPDARKQEMLAYAEEHYGLHTYQLVPLDLMCRHTVGLNYTAIGIEMVGESDQDVLNNAGQLSAALDLTLWLMQR